jgi:hypothetical protein
LSCGTHTCLPLLYNPNYTVFHINHSNAPSVTVIVADHFKFYQQGPDSGIQGLATKQSHWASSPTKDEHAKNEEKAALLKAKLLEKRTSSRGPIPDENTGVFKPPTASNVAENAVQEIPENNVDIENLVREAREAAGREAQIKQNTDPWINADQVKQMETSVNQKDGQNSPGLAGKMMESAPRQPSKKNKPAASFTPSKTLDNRKPKNQQQSSKNAVATETKRSGAHVKPGTGSRNQSTVTGSNNKGTSVDSSKTSGNSRGDATKTASSQPTRKTHSRSDTLGSTSTIQPDPNNSSNSVNERDSKITAKGDEQKSDLTHTVAQSMATASTGTTLARSENSPQSDPELTVANGEMALLNAHDGITAARYSHHFDDLDEWLEVTGYHDRGNREKVLKLYRQRAELERQMTEVERELEKSSVHRARSIQGSTGGQLRDMVPPPTSTIANAITASSRSDVVEPATAEVNVGGKKRPRSPEMELALASPGHIGKQRRLSSDMYGKEMKSIEPPTGPR